MIARDGTLYLIRFIAAEGVATGLPMLRAMFFRDPSCCRIERYRENVAGVRDTCR